MLRSWKVVLVADFFEYEHLAFGSNPVAVDECHLPLGLRSTWTIRCPLLLVSGSGQVLAHRLNPSVVKQK